MRVESLKMNSSDGSTVGLSGAGGAGDGRPAPRSAVPALTVLCHPDLRRVGDRAPLPELALGRAPRALGRRLREMGLGNPMTP